MGLTQPANAPNEKYNLVFIIKTVGGDVHPGHLKHRKDKQRLLAKKRQKVAAGVPSEPFLPPCDQDYKVGFALGARIDFWSGSAQAIEPLGSSMRIGIGELVKWQHRPERLPLKQVGRVFDIEHVIG